MNITSLQFARGALPRITAATILDDEDQPAMSVADATGREPGRANAPARHLSFVVTLSNPSDSTITVNYGTSDGTAVAGGTNQPGKHTSDYTATTGTLTFEPGSLSETIDVPVLHDVFSELSETMTVELRDPVNASISTATGTGTIRDASALPKIEIESFVGRAQFSEDIGTIRITITVNHPDLSGLIVSGRDITLDYEITEL